MKINRNDLITLIIPPLYFLNSIIEKHLNNADKIIPIYFHNPSKFLFESLIMYFKSMEYEFLSLDKAIELSTESKSFRKSICITIDDGWRDNIYNIIPIAQKFNIPVTFFITTDAITYGFFWWELINRFSGFDIDYLKGISNADRLEILRIIKKKVYSSQKIIRSAMTLKELRDISKLSFVTIGSHTISHPCLNKTTLCETEYEIIESKKILENWIQKEVKHFAFPNGDYSDFSIEVLKKAKYLTASTTQFGFLDKDSDLFLLNRNSINDKGSVKENICHAYGSWGYLNSFKNLVINK